MTTIHLNDKQYRITHEQNSYHMVYRICSTPSGPKLFRVDDIEKLAVINAHLDAELEDDLDIIAEHDDFLAGTR